MWKCALLVLLTGCASAQWLDYRTPGIPRTREGKPNLSASAPRAPNGKPDLTGVWQIEPATFEETGRMLEGGQNGLGEAPPSKYFLNILNILADFKNEEAPLQPAAAATFQRNAAAMGKDSPNTRCLPYDVPGYNTVPAPFKIVQTPPLVVVLNEADTSFRQIFTDGRKLPVDPQPAWLGYSVGKWEGDSLVVESIGFNDKSWLDVFGHVHSDALHVTERFRRRDFGHMEIQVTMEDPKTLTKPVTVKLNEILMPDTDLLESFCAENEKDIGHIYGK